MDAFPGAIYAEDRDERLPLHYACMNEGAVSALLNKLWDKQLYGQDCHSTSVILISLSFCVWCTADVIVGACAALLILLSQVANFLVNELAFADPDGANKYDRYGKLPLNYAQANTGNCCTLEGHVMQTCCYNDLHVITYQSLQRDQFSPLQLDQFSSGLAAKQAYWTTIMTTMLIKHKDYIKGDEV